MMKIRRSVCLCLLLLVALTCLTPAQASAGQTASPTPSPTCTECALSATRADGIATDWSLQVTPAMPQVADRAVVQAVMFWMDSCGHCHYILEEVLPLLQARYGESFEILLVELKTTEDADRLYQTAEELGLAKEQVSVPFLIIGEQVLIGSQQIPAELPELIDRYLAAGGLDYPDLQPLADILPSKDPTGDPQCVPDTPCPEATTTPAPPEQTQSGIPSAGPSASEPRPNGFTLAIAVLTGMIASLGFTGFVFIRRRSTQPVVAGRDWRSFAIPMLAIIGLGVAGYLAYVETRAIPAFCGPVGDCNMVQSSSYARLFGVLPIGVLGVAGYLAILGVWSLNRVRPGRLARHAPRAILGMALAGTLFSIYLTYLELFVIQAICIWCLTSAVLITLLLVVSARPAVTSPTRPMQPSFLTKSPNPPGRSRVKG